MSHPVVLAAEQSAHRDTDARLRATVRAALTPIKRPQAAQEASH